MKSLLTLITIFFLTLAQDNSAGYQQALNKANLAMNQALSSYQAHYPDKPLWAEAINWAKTANDLEPDKAQGLKTLAKIYSYVKWYGRAYGVWEKYLEQTNSLDAETKELFRETALKQAYARYVQEDFDDSLRIYKKIIKYLGYDKNAYLWAARIGLEQNQIPQSINYLQAILSKEDDESAKYLLNQAFAQKRELDAVNELYLTALEELESGEIYQAKLKLLKLIAIDDENDLAWSTMARASFIQKNYLDAFIFYEKASSLKPENSDYRLQMLEAQKLASQD